MWQQLALDRTPGRLYYPLAFGAVLVVVGCGPHTSPIAPADLPAATAANAQAWVNQFVPTRPTRYDVRWTLQTQQGQVRGRAAAQFAPPDSLRFDYQGPFGRSGAAVMVGDSIVWSEPEEEVRSLIPVTPLFWAALGLPRPPDRRSRVYGRASAETGVWRYVRGADTLTYVQASAATLEAEMRQAGKVIGTVEVEFADTVRAPLRSRIAFPQTASAILFELEALDTLSSVGPETWRRP